MLGYLGLGYSIAGARLFRTRVILLLGLVLPRAFRDKDILLLGLVLVYLELWLLYCGG